ncbi:oxalate decarboxylase family bicupin [Myxococcus qinghaiensis]|uniref:oxalate decarboxylase family bicupin n=1 Tax=Myxococcus qinghaiensis TaxID=2906758 RepID=UPI0020A797BD|nr:oxalate decarboxylase family bicupin [Myxococcus qinghaiensis]MCP3165631.1 oxalate decarboxylase family bicupin [Myxococcus qinghaiensis]
MSDEFVERTGPQLAPPQPIRNGSGATVLGPRNPPREAENPNLLVPPRTDHGSMPNLRWSFADSRMRLEEGGWARQTTVRELPIATEIAGVNMRLKKGAVRELHFHKEGEWAYMLKGRARISAVDRGRKTFLDDVSEGDLWFFPSGVPHSIQGLGPDGCEFLLVFDNGTFDENETFLLTDWLAHIPKDVLAKNFGVPESAFANIPAHELYIFLMQGPGPVGNLTLDLSGGEGPVSPWFSYRLHSQEPIRTKGGTVRIVDSSNFQASKSIAAALVEVEPGAMRELHWHANAAEWQYYISGQARMTVFASSGNAATFDYMAGDVGYVPRMMPHYVENTGKTTLRFLETFRSDHFEDLSLRRWLSLTPHDLVRGHLRIDESVLAGIPPQKSPVIPL